MKLRHLKSSSVVVEEDGTRVLCDPWLQDGAFYGSWAHYPPLSFEPEDYADVDYIYVSHIHPDHCHLDTLDRLDKDTPVIIHDYQWDFLANNLERLGFDVVELDHDERMHLGGDLHLNVLASDDCDPEVCGKYFGCGWFMDDVSGGTAGSTQIDSMGVFDNGDEVLVNANDCRWPMTSAAAQRVLDRYGGVDMLLMQYGAANFYPQCMLDYTHEERLEAADEVAEEMLQDAESFVQVFEPDYFMPFAGSYTLSGPLSDLNQYLGVATRAGAREYFRSSPRVPEGSECILLNSEEYFDLTEGRQSAEYTPVDPERKQQYIDDVLADRSFTFHSDDMPTLSELQELLPVAYDHMEEKRQGIGFESDTTILLDLVEDTVAAISLRGEGIEYVSQAQSEEIDEYVRMRIDPRLLHKILRGPQYAHYNNAQIGSHVHFAKEPDIYERPVYYCMNYFHA
ncbi:MBL fold metallo-hydrolase [Haloarchaeobius sp. HRN-SO-5]|uniref:MBL fold metallo-hydrolase n=1 Tax=Haloarchaeobius sp. HRN-SO-5 TaxID=3446118 RepID=UPI003EB9B09E